MGRITTPALFWLNLLLFYYMFNNCNPTTASSPLKVLLNSFYLTWPRTDTHYTTTDKHYIWRRRDGLRVPAFSINYKNMCSKKDCLNYKFSTGDVLQWLFTLDHSYSHLESKGFAIVILRTLCKIKRDY